ncbi:MAG: alpha/beta hydrolase family protein [bacterium]|nr:alpha/beta hydrolase family protein [bacterium]
MKTKFFHRIALSIALTIGASIAVAQTNVTTDVVTVNLQTDTVKVMSQKMNREIKAVVVLPHQYFDNPTDSFPSVYVLHGASGDYSNWPKKKNLEQVATQYGVVMICPDGQDSWYFDSPIDPKMQFETFISRELVAYVDSHYRTFRSAKMRAITGLSMGGHGALWNAFRHPDVWGSCGSMSGGVDITKFTDRWHIKARLGNYEDNPERWHQHAVVNLVPSIQHGQNIIIDDGADDFFYQVNCNLHEALLKAKIPHDFTIRPGAHSWKYWINALDYHMLFFSKAFSK